MYVADFRIVKNGVDVGVGSADEGDQWIPVTDPATGANVSNVTWAELIGLDDAPGVDLVWTSDVDEGDDPGE